MGMKVLDGPANDARRRVRLELFVEFGEFCVAEVSAGA
jgi:hypothetical protein